MPLLLLLRVLAPGMGGWPTVRYFNKETGYAGAPYEKQTPMAMCEELGMGQPYLENFVEDKGNTASCDAFSKVGCVDKQKAFIDKWVDRPLEEVSMKRRRSARDALLARHRCTLCWHRLRSCGFSWTWGGRPPWSWPAWRRCAQAA
eukprot:scaffold7204_cov354-Prasinococcus_capsulatus_cf.AAC.13